MGGETTPAGTGQVAGNGYNRFDIYNPVTKTWRLDVPLKTPRHGIFPVVYGERIYVADGGVVAGFSYSGVDDVLRR